MMRFLVAYFFIAGLSLNAFADDLSGTVKLATGDSIRLFSALQTVGLTVEPDATTPEITVRKANFRTSDGALEIICEKKDRNAVDISAECSININSLKSQDAITSFSDGAAKGFVIIDILNKFDVNILKNSATKLLGYFITTEKVDAYLPEIDDNARFSKFTVNCYDSSNACQVAIFKN